MSGEAEQNVTQITLRLVANFLLLLSGLLLLFEVVMRYTGLRDVLGDGFAIALEIFVSSVISGGLVGIREGREASAEKALTRIALIILAIGGIGWLTLPYQAQQLNANALATQQNAMLQQDKQLAQAEMNRAKAMFLAAERLQPNNPQIQLNLGNFYEIQGNRSDAQTAYQKAADAQLESANNNLGRLLILDGQPATALPYLQAGLQRATSPLIRYKLYKNLGWAQWQLDQYAEAENSLQTAIDLMPEEGAAYCLQGQLLRDQDRLDEERVMLLQCQRYGNSADPDELEWMGAARTRLDAIAP